MASCHILMHFSKNLPHTFTQILIKHHFFSSMRGSIEQCTFGYIRTIHLFQAHGLCTELQLVSI